MNKICVYTCITGNYDNLKEVNKESGIDYYCFTNNKNIKSNSWKIIYIEDNKLSNVKLARKIKILGHERLEKYNILLWMDAAVSFKKKIRDFINYYLDDKHDFVAFRHGVRDNIKDEAYECVKLGKETKENVFNILNFYKKNNYPDDNGLIESTVFIKRNSEVVKETMKIWFDMILNYSHRDQLSFNYCIFKTDLNVKWINKKVFDNEWFNWERHNNLRKIEKYRLYFGSEEEYDLNLDIQGNYSIKDNVYTIKTISPISADKFVIAPCHIRATILKEIKVNGKVIKNCDFISSYKYERYNLFFDENPFIVINKKVNKGDKLIIDLKMDILNDENLLDVIENMTKKIIKCNSALEEANNTNNELNYKLELIYSGRFWKLKEKLKKIIK